MAGRTVSLTRPLDSWIDGEVEEGRSQNASELVRVAVEDLRAKRLAQAALRNYCGSLLGRADRDREQGLPVREYGSREELSALLDDLDREVDAEDEPSRG